MNDTRFFSAVHLLILVSEAVSPMSSAQIAESIGTNPSWVRRLATSLREAGIIASSPGKTGFTLAVPPCDLPLLDVYRAACGQESVHVFDAHRNPSDECIVGRHIRPVVGTLLPRRRQRGHGQGRRGRLQGQDRAQDLECARFEKQYGPPVTSQEARTPFALAGGVRSVLVASGAQ